MTVRREDAALLTGAARFTADLRQPQDVIAVFLRSQRAHADFSFSDLAVAREMPGVLGVFTHDDLLSLVPGYPDQLDNLTNADGSAATTAPRPVLAQGRVRFAGEAMALIVAESLHAAQDAAEMIGLDYEDRPVITDPADPEAEVTLDWRGGDYLAVEAALAAGAHVVEARVRIPRLNVMPMEPAGARAEWDGDRYTLTLPGQGAHTLRNELADHALCIPREKLRVVVPDVGGAFGARIHIIPEQAALLAAARLVGRPVLWTAERMEGMLCEPHARDFDLRAKLGLDEDGRFLALSIEGEAAAGAYVHPWSRPNPTVGFFQGALGPYRIAVATARIRVVLTNTAPTGPFRGAGEPEGCHLRETLIDAAARHLGIAPLALRKRNLLCADDLPLTLPSGFTVDSGDPAAVLAALDALPRSGQPAPEGWPTGEATALYMKKNGVGRSEKAEFTLARDGRLRLGIGSQCNGQGHATTFANLAARSLGIDSGLIDVVQGDTDAIAFGTGTGGSSALGTTGTGVVHGCAALVDACRARAAVLWGTEPETLRYGAGVIADPRTNRSLSLSEIATETGEVKVIGASDPVQTFTFGAHAARVAVDPETGAVDVLDYRAADDLGPIQEPALARGQILGGIAQGLSQALMEAMRYDTNGQPVSGSLMDYALPRAADLPEPRTTFVETRSQTTPLGIRGAGEAGAVPSMTVVVAAVNAALGLTGAARLDPPLSPSRVWTAARSRVKPLP